MFTLQRSEKGFSAAQVHDENGHPISPLKEKKKQRQEKKPQMRGWTSPHVKYQIETALPEALKANNSEKALMALRVIQGEGFSPSTEIYESVLTSFKSSFEYERGVRLFREMRTNDVPIRARTILIVLDLYHKQRDYKASVEILNSLEDYGVRNNPGICNQVMKTCIECHQFHIVESIFQSMESARISPNFRTFGHLARAYANHNVDDETIMAVVKKMKRYNIPPDAEIYNGFLANIESVAHAEHILKMMHNSGISPNTDSYARYVNLLINADRTPGVKTLLDHLYSENILLTPDCYIPWIVVSKTPVEALERHQTMISRNIASSSESWCALFSILRGMKAWDELVQEFSVHFRSSEREVPAKIYPLLIDAYLHQGDLKTCLDLMQEMRASGLDTSQIKLELPT